MLTGLKRSLRKRGLVGTVRAVGFAGRCVLVLRGKRGLEIGGPSNFFRNIVPVYRVVRSLDNCVFSSETIWEGERSDGEPFEFLPGRRKPGRNRIVDGADLAGIRDSEYEFVLSSHSLEHIANPIKALMNWRRVAPGYLVLIVPHYRDTFDHRRLVTTLHHMIADFERDVGEDDLTHLQEVLDLSDLSRLELPEGMTLERAKQLADPRDNARNRCMHHNVFDVDNTCQLLNYCGYRTLAHQIAASSIFILAKA